MEHRLGTRFAIDVPIWWATANREVVSIGRLSNVSLSGGFIADFSLRSLSLLQISFELPVQSTTAMVPAYVARRCAEGSGVEWCEWAPAAICDLLRPIAADSISGARLAKLFMGRA